MSGQIFISYRREDSSAWAGRLYDHLEDRFALKIFRDDMSRQAATPVATLSAK
jgi:hypothetical protein